MQHPLVTVSNRYWQVMTVGQGKAKREAGKHILRKLWKFHTVCHDRTSGRTAACCHDSDQIPAQPMTSDHHYDNITPSTYDLAH